MAYSNSVRIILEMALHSGDRVQDVLVVEHDPKLTSTLFREFAQHIGSSLLISVSGRRGCPGPGLSGHNFPGGLPGDVADEGAHLDAAEVA